MQTLSDNVRAQSSILRNEGSYRETDDATDEHVGSH